MRRLGLLVAVILGSCLALSQLVGAQQIEEAEALNTEVARLYGQGKFAEAVVLALQSLEINERALGPEHPRIAVSLNNLALLYQVQSRYADAEPLYKRSLEINETTFGPDHPQVALSLGNLATLYFVQDRYTDAEPHFRRSLAIYEKALGPDHLDVAISLNGLAGLYDHQGRYSDAEPLFKRSLAIREKLLGPEHPQVATALSNLALLYSNQGRYADAEPLYQRSLAICDKVLGPEHPQVALLLNNLAELYRAHSRYTDAEALYVRSLAVYDKAFGRDHPDVALSLNNLALLYDSLGRYSDAEQLYNLSRAIYEKVLGPDSPQVALSLNNLAALYRTQGRNADAEPIIQRSLAIYEKALGPDHPQVGLSLNNLALQYDNQGRYADAEPLFKRALAITEKALGPDHPRVAASFNNLAALDFARGNWVGAAEHWRKATAVIQRRAERGLAAASGVTGKQKTEAQQNDWVFLNFVKAAHLIKAESPAPNADATHSTLAAEMFEIAQWARTSEAAASLGQMAARGAASDPSLATLARERQDLIEEWQKSDAARTAAVTRSPEKRDKNAEAANAARLFAIDKRLAEIDARFAKEFPEYAALVGPKPLSIEAVQSQVRSDEALVLFLDTPEFKRTPEETFIWVVTNTDSRWVRSDLGTEALEQHVAALRCGLDAAAWTGDGEARCKKLLGGAFTAKDAAKRTPLPFDVAKAHALYKGLFGQVEDLVKDKHLLLVPSGPLMQLPFQVLVTAPPAGDNLKRVAWLILDHAITVLPAVSSLKALRSHTGVSRAANPMIAFANPSLDGEAKKKGNDMRRRMAHYRQDCALPPSPEEVISDTAAEFHMASLGAASKIAEVKALEPVPGTAKIVCDIARYPAFEGSKVLLGDNATEARLKQLNMEGDLSRYRIVQFATHGLTAGQIADIAEPGLILTPPETSADPDDNGYLTASEITQLKLDADWVILSACNTAAGGGAGGEALSGLARAFFYARARSLLVSHWSVKEAAAITLVTASIRSANEPGVGRSEALRRAMISLIDGSSERVTHPSYWAPFVVVGEGSAAN